MYSAAVVPAGIAVIVAEVGAVPASVGAYRLGWYLALSDDIVDEAHRAALLTGMSEDVLERVVKGEVVPGEDERQWLGIATNGEVLPDDWDWCPVHSWSYPPRPRLPA